MNGFAGKIARINLSSCRVRVEEPDELFYRMYMGGKGFVCYYLLKEVSADIDPYSEHNKLVFANGVLTGVPVAGMSRFVVGAKSPLIKGYGQSEAGGFWGPELKRAGYDALIIEGKSEKPVYISITDSIIEIRDATHLWGKETGEAQDIIRKELNNDKTRVALIGPGGERLVRYACIVNELRHANGRSGMGAVMGSKMLKAIAVKGSKKISYTDEAKVLEIGKNYAAMYMENSLSRGLYEYGTSASVMSHNAIGLLPTRNFRKGEFYKAEKISAETMIDTIFKKREGCFACPIRCKRTVEIKEEDISVDKRFGGPEYETLAAFGSLCEVDDLKVIAKANEFCNRYTLDTISAGSAIAFAMECVEKGILSKEDFDGLDVCFGNSSVILPLLEKIASREGIGDLLAEGTQIAAMKIGKGANDLLINIKGKEIAMHDARGKSAVGLGFAVGEIAADHMTCGHDTMFTKKGPNLDSMESLGFFEPLDANDLSYKKIRMFIYMYELRSFYDAAGICYFVGAPRGSMSIKEITKLLRAVTGWDIGLWEMIKVGERSINISRCFNIKCGFTKDDDILPDKMFKPLENGKQKGILVDKDEFKKAVSTYYMMMGWDDKGIPSCGKLLELDLQWVVEMM